MYNVLKSQSSVNKITDEMYNLETDINCLENKLIQSHMVIDI